MPWYFSTVLTFCLAVSFCAFMEAFSSKYERNRYKKEYERICKEYENIEDELEKHKLNELILMDKINKLQRKYCYSNSNKVENGINYVPKGTIKYIRLAMKYTHPDVGGSNEEFIKCNNIYKELKEKYKEI